MKISILLAYYDRPNMVNFALDSILKQTHDDWELIAVDDTSSVPLEPIIKEKFRDKTSKVKFFNTQDKMKNTRGSYFGEFWNIGVKMSDSDLAIMLCDDDALVEDSLTRLSSFYERNPQINYSYGHVYVFDPFCHNNYDDLPKNINHKLNENVGEINPWCKVDASQVSWRTDAIKTKGISFAAPLTVNLDADLYSKLYNLYGPCPFNGMYVQHKAIHSDQLGNRPSNYNVRDIEFYNNNKRDEK